MSIQGVFVKRVWFSWPRPGRPHSYDLHLQSLKVPWVGVRPRRSIVLVSVIGGIVGRSVRRAGRPLRVLLGSELLRRLPGG